MKRALLDQGLAPHTAKLLRSAGWEALHVAEAQLSQATDAEVLGFADRGNWTCVTLDHDFHAHLAAMRAGHPSVAFLRAQGLDSKAQPSTARHSTPRRNRLQN